MVGLKCETERVHMLEKVQRDMLGAASVSNTTVDVTKQNAFCELLLVARQGRSNLVILMVAKRGRLHCDSKTPTAP
jgi:hypothetical protein